MTLFMHSILASGVCIQYWIIFITDSINVGQLVTLQVIWCLFSYDLTAKVSQGHLKYSDSINVVGPWLYLHILPLDRYILCIKCQQLMTLRSIDQLINMQSTLI